LTETFACPVGPKANLRHLDIKLAGWLRMETRNGLQWIVAVFTIWVGVILSAMEIIGNFTAHDLGAGIPLNNAKIPLGRDVA
jgi:hypothetical protein